MFFEAYRDNTPFYHIGDNTCVAHFHRSTEILYILSGEKTVIIDKREYLLTGDTAILIPPYAVHIMPPGNQSKQIALSVRAESAARFDAFMQKNMPVCHFVPGNEEMRSLAFAVKNAGNLILYEGIVNHLLGLMIEEMEFQPKPADGANSQIRQIVQFIDEHFAEKLSLPLLSRQFGYSPNYFSTVFRRYFRTSLPQYINAVRVKKSLPLLKTMTVAGASYECGFQNPQTYFLAFRQVMGCTPHEYAKTIK